MQPVVETNIIKGVGQNPPNSRASWTSGDYHKEPRFRQMCSDFPGGSVVESACQCRRCGFDPWVEKRDRGAWWATVHGITKGQTWLRDWTTTTITKRSLQILRSGSRRKYRVLWEQKRGMDQLCWAGVKRIEGSFWGNICVWDFICSFNYFRSYSNDY